MADPDAAPSLRPQPGDPAVAVAGGSDGNVCPDSLLDRLIHEEINEPHRRMPADVNFLVTFNVLCQRDMLEGLRLR